MLIFALHLVNLVRQGVYFDLRVIRALQRVGASAVVASLGIMFAYTVWPWMITSQNMEHKRGLQFGYDSSQAGIALLGLGVFMLGWVVKCTILMRQENEEFV